MITIVTTYWGRTYSIPEDKMSNLEKAEEIWSKSSWYDKTFHRSELISKLEKILWADKKILYADKSHIIIV